VRHVRMLGVVALAIFAVGATFAAVASAKKTESTPELLERLFGECPFGSPGITQCEYGEAGKESFFQAGKVTVHFKKPVILRAGLIENGITGALTTIGSRYGNTISREAEPAPSLTEGVDAELLPEREKQRYEEYLAKGGSTKVTATIELAAPAEEITLHEGTLFEETNEGEGNSAFSFPVEIHLSNKFLGTHCYDGNDVEPIVVPFWTGLTNPSPPNTPIHGSKGTLEVIGEGTVLQLGQAKLVNNTYAAPGVEGCGIEGGADAAVNAALGLPSPSGSNSTELIGNLDIAGVEAVEEHIKPY
jgi:hypothetical protein